MEILLVHHCDTWGGAGASLKICIEMLLEGGHQISVCIPHEDAEVLANLKKIPARISFLPCNTKMAMISAFNGGPKFFSRTFWRNLSTIFVCRKKIAEMLDEYHFDLVIINSMTTSWICQLTKKRNIPSLIYVRETRPHYNRFGFALISYFVERYSSGQVFISEFDKNNSGFKNGLQRVFRNSLHVDVFKVDATRSEACEKLRLDPTKTNFLFVGGGDLAKGYGVLMQAMELIVDKDISLVVAGHVVNSNKRDDDRIVYMGMVFDMPILYRACDVLVFPSTKAHQARPAFEAGIMGLPVIISDFPETAETVQSGYNGLVFKPDNSQDLAEKMLDLKKNKTKREYLGENNREKSLTNHNYDRTQRDFNDFILEFDGRK